MQLSCRLVLLPTPTADRKKNVPFSKKPPGCQHANLVSTLGVTQREPPLPLLKNPSYAPEYSYLPSWTRCAPDWNREHNSVKRVYMPLAPDCQIMSWQKSQFASQLVVQKRIDKIWEVEGRPVQRNRPDSRILISFACGVRNPGLSNPENSSRNPESH